MENDSPVAWQVVLFDLLKKVSINLALAALFWIGIGKVCGFQAPESGGWLYLILIGLWQFWTTFLGHVLLTASIVILAYEIYALVTDSDDLKRRKAQLEAGFEKEMEARTENAVNLKLRPALSDLANRQRGYVRLLEEQDQKRIELAGR